MLRHLKHAAMLAVLLVNVWPQAGAHAQPAPPQRLDFAGSVTWLGQIPVLVAVDKGFFAREGLDVRIQIILNSSDRMRALSAGSVAFSNLGRVAVIAEMARGNRDFYYFANIDDAPGNEGCWARAGFASFADLRGRRVAANSSAEITMAGLLEAAGMRVSDVAFVNLPPNEMALALASGDVDAACIWQPLLDRLRSAAPRGGLLGTDRDTPIFRQFGTMSAPDIVVISRRLVDEHPEQATRLARALFAGADYAATQPEDTARTVAHYFRQTPEEVLAGMRAFSFYGRSGWQDHMRRQTAQMQYLAQWLHTNGRIDAVPDAARWENTSFLAGL